MNDREFDCAMRWLALSEGQRVSTEKLERVLRSLPPAAPTASTRPRIRMAAVLVALLLLAVGVAVAARLGLSAFWANNPYRFFSQPGAHGTPGAHVAPHGRGRFRTEQPSVRSAGQRLD